MLRNFIRDTAVESWQGDLDDFLGVFESQPREKQADYFIYATKTRAGAQVEGFFILPDGTTLNNPELMAYPIMINVIEKMMAALTKKGAVTEAACLSIWLHTLRAYLYPELRPSVERMWSVIAATKDLWPEMLNSHYTLDREDGIDKEKLRKVYKLASEILQLSPPKFESLPKEDTRIKNDKNETEAGRRLFNIQTVLGMILIPILILLPSDFLFTMIRIVAFILLYSFLSALWKPQTASRFPSLGFAVLIQLALFALVILLGFRFNVPDFATIAFLVFIAHWIFAYRSIKAKD